MTEFLVIISFTSKYRDFADGDDTYTYYQFSSDRQKFPSDFNHMFSKRCRLNSTHPLLMFVRAVLIRLAVFESWIGQSLR